VIAARATATARRGLDPSSRSVDVRSATTDGAIDKPAYVQRYAASTNPLVSGCNARGWPASIVNGSSTGKPEHSVADIISPLVRTLS